jgi:transposase
MAKVVLTEKQIEVLLKNKYVKSVNKAGNIVYTDEFRIYFINENSKGKFPRVIYEECGFDINAIGQKRIESSGTRFRNAYRKDGMNGLISKSNRKKTKDINNKDLTIEERYKLLLVENEMLKAEYEVLKKIDLLERGLITKL